MGNARAADHARFLDGVSRYIRGSVSLTIAAAIC
jgi:hypothetical protein